MNDEEFARWQEQRNAAMFAALVELMDVLLTTEWNAPGFKRAVKNCYELVEGFDD
jgi:hypothetical protein